MMIVTAHAPVLIREEAEALKAAEGCEVEATRQRAMTQFEG
jgi:hypothetical protein